MAELPSRPDLDQLRRQAKELRRAAAAGDPHAAARVRAVSGEVTLAAAQLALAREHGFGKWPDMKAAVEERLPAAADPVPSGNPGRPAVYGAGDFPTRSRSQGWEAGPVPVGAVLTSQTFLTTYLEERPDRFRASRELRPTNGRVFLTVAEPVVAVSCLGVGAGPLVTHLEHLVGLGVASFVAVGPAPAVSTGLRWGDCVVATAAVRDDGISQHYLEPARHSYPDGGLTDRLVGEAAGSGLDPLPGTVWTVPTPYRTTAEELETHRREGVLATDLSTAALFAVGTALGVRTASAMIATRTLGAAAASAAPDQGRSRRIFSLLESAVRVLAHRREDGN